MVYPMITRQPIFSTTLDVVGYELLFYDGTEAPPCGAGATPGAIQTALDALKEIGLPNLVGDQKAHLCISRTYLRDKNPLPLPPESVVVSLPDEASSNDAESQEILAALAQQGFQLALDKVVSAGKVAKLLSQVQIARIDLASMDRVSLAETVKRLRLHRVRLLATNVETQDDLALCQRLGFEYVQGYFLCKPRIVQGRRLDASRSVVMRLAAS